VRIIWKEYGGERNETDTLKGREASSRRWLFDHTKRAGVGERYRKREIIEIFSSQSKSSEKRLGSVFNENGNRCAKTRQEEKHSRLQFQRLKCSSHSKRFRLWLLYGIRNRKEGTARSREDKEKKSPTKRQNDVYTNEERALP